MCSDLALPDAHYFKIKLPYTRELSAIFAPKTAPVLEFANFLMRRLFSEAFRFLPWRFKHHLAVPCVCCNTACPLHPIGSNTTRIRFLSQAWPCQISAAPLRPRPAWRFLYPFAATGSSLPVGPRYKCCLNYQQRCHWHGSNF